MHVVYMPERLNTWRALYSVAIESLPPPLKEHPQSPGPRLPSHDGRHTLSIMANGAQSASANLGGRPGHAGDSRPWHVRISKLIKAFRSASDAASFRAGWARALPSVPAEQAQLLVSVPQLLDKWVNPDARDGRTAQQDWQEFHSVAKDRLPSAVLEAILGKLPSTKPGGTHWDEFVLEARKPALIDVLLGGHHVGTKDLNRLAAARPREFYQSAALDVLIRRKALRDLESVLRDSLAEPARAQGLLAREQVVVQWYSTTHSAKRDEQMCAALLASMQLADAVFELLLEHRLPAVRFCQHMLSARSKRAKKSVTHAATIGQLLVRWLTLCDAELDKAANPRQMTASLLIGVMHLAMLSSGNLPASTDDSNLTLAITTLARKSALAALLAHEQDQPKPVAIVMRSHDLYHTVHQYLSKLQGTTTSGDDVPDRASRFHRYMGRREAIEQMLQALESPSDGDNLRGILEAALYNLGVRSLETTGAVVPFDFREHESETPGTMDGDKVKIVRPGRVLGSEDVRIVLSRAVVARV